MTLKEYADIMGISISLAYKLAQKNQIPIIRLGQRRIVVVRDVVEKILAGAGTTGINKVVQKYEEAE